jgi:predicted ATP-binding protein involved in virulence
MRLHKIVLKNFRLFPSLECTLHPELTVLVADNGGGKTSLLDAISIAMGTYLGAFPKGKGARIKPADVFSRVDDPELGRMQTVYPATIETSGTLREVEGSRTWIRELSSAKSHTTIKYAKVLSKYASSLQQTNMNEPEDWPLLAYYGTGRLWNQKYLTGPKLFSSGFHDRAAGYIDCMEPASSFKYFVDWFGHAYRSIFQSKLRFTEAHPNATRQDIDAHTSAFSPLVDAVRGAVDTVLAPSGWGSINYSETLQTLTAKHEQYGVLEVEQLSDGIRNVIAMVGDIAFRAVQLNAHLGARAALETSGIALIDEVDMHLHPSWQQVILKSLCEAFPRIQFIVTTHSPQVLSTVRSENIRVLAQNVDGMITANLPLAKTYGEPSGDVLHSVMMVDPQPPVLEKPDLQRLTELVDQGAYKSEEAQSLMQTLRVALGVRHPQLQRLQRNIERQDVLNAVKS